MASQVVDRVVGLFTVDLERGLMPKILWLRLECCRNVAEMRLKCCQNFTLNVLSVGRCDGQVNELI